MQAFFTYILMSPMLREGTSANSNRAIRLHQQDRSPCPRSRKSSQSERPSGRCSQWRTSSADKSAGRCRMIPSPSTLPSRSTPTNRGHNPIENTNDGCRFDRSSSSPSFPSIAIVHASSNCCLHDTRFLPRVHTIVLFRSLLLR